MHTPSIEPKPTAQTPQNQPHSKPPTWLLDHTHNVNSQHGEDGIIEQILKTINAIPTTNSPAWVVEFGAWDGVLLSNAKHLIDSHNFHALMIEGDAERCKQIAENYPGNDRVHPLNAFVGFTKDDGLDSILQNANLPKDFDFVSIDVDGNDYHIWKAMVEYRPKLVCIEYNPTVPNEVDFVQPPDHTLNQGAGPKSFVELAKSKGYQLVCATQTNLFFVLDQYFPLFEIEDNTLETIRTDTSLVTRIFCGYDGTIFLDGLARCPWNGMRIDTRKVQQIPSYLRRYPQNYNLFQRVLFRIFRYLPGFLRRKIT